MLLFELANNKFARVYFVFISSVTLVQLKFQCYSSIVALLLISVLNCLKKERIGRLQKYEQKVCTWL